MIYVFFIELFFFVSHSENDIKMNFFRKFFLCILAQEFKVKIYQLMIDKKILYVCKKGVFKRKKLYISLQLLYL